MSKRPGPIAAFFGLMNLEDYLGGFFHDFILPRCMTPITRIQGQVIYFHLHATFCAFDRLSDGSAFDPTDPPDLSRISPTRSAIP
jgi:hypothetical protein